MKRQTWWVHAGGMLFVCVAACGDDASERPAPLADASSAASAAAIPATEQLCTLAPNESDESDLRAVFGEPSEAKQGSDRALGYRFADESTWWFYIDAQGIWSGYTVQNGGSGEASIPECWRPDGGFWRPPDGGYWERPDGGYVEPRDGGWR